MYLVGQAAVEPRGCVAAVHALSSLDWTTGWVYLPARLHTALTSERPLYRQLIDHLRREIAGEAPGSRITSEPQLARTFRVSRFTVSRAIEALVDEGLLYRRQGLGTFVAAPPLKRAPAYLMSFSEAVRDAGHTPSHRLLGFGPMPWRPDLPYAEDEPLVALDRLRFVDGLPAAIHRSAVSAALGEAIGLTRAVAADPSFSLYGFLAAAGLVVERGIERLSARLASVSERRLLQLERNAVVMAVQRRSCAGDGSLLDVVDAVYDARRYTYEARLLRRAEVDASGTNGNNREMSHAADFHDARTVGPRLGPWDDVRRSQRR
jgi:GntR family transcriptional regulator